MKKHKDGTEGYFFFSPHDSHLWYGVDLYDIDDDYNEGCCYGIPMFSVMHDKFMKVSYNNDTNFKNILDILAQSALNYGCKFKFIDCATYERMCKEEKLRRKINNVKIYLGFISPIMMLLMNIMRDCVGMHL